MTPSARVRAAARAASRAFPGVVRRVGTDLGALVLATLLLAATFLNPTVMLERARFDHVIVLDVTQSMNVEDEQLAGKPVSRLAFAKDAMRRLLPELPCGSKVGWGIFTEYRALLLVAPVEVCANRGELQATLEHIDGRMAWSGNSEIAKGLHSGLGIAKLLPDAPSLVFLTDGHEAPPLDPRHRPRFDDKPGEVPGVVVGVGGLRPEPIPKTDPLGRPLGVWRADDVMQGDVNARGRAGSLGGERMVEDGPEAAGADALGRTPGSEHLSAMHESYLRLLAGEQGLAFHHLQSAAGFAKVLNDPALARPLRGPVDLRPLLASVALALLVSRHFRMRRKKRTVRVTHEHP